MGDRTGIGWTDATWNPVTGCTKVSSGCDFCYAESVATRFAGTPAYPNGFDVTLREGHLDQPLRWTRPRRVFVNSMSDLFHDEIPTDFIARVFAVMALTRRHTYQVLTKRHARMRALLASDDFKKQVHDAAKKRFNHPKFSRHREAAGWPFTIDGVTVKWPLPNVWVGVSVEDQQWADIRIPVLLATPAAVRFLSMEPLLGPVDLTPHMPPVDPHDGREVDEWGIHWVIVGGESGPGARPMSADWITPLQEQCADAGAAFFFKQAGNVLAREWGLGRSKGADPQGWPQTFPQEFPNRLSPGPASRG